MQNQQHRSTTRTGDRTPDLSAESIGPRSEIVTWEEMQALLIGDLDAQNGTTTVRQIQSDTALRETFASLLEDEQEHDPAVGCDVAMVLTQLARFYEAMANGSRAMGSLAQDESAPAWIRDYAKAAAGC